MNFYQRKKMVVRNVTYKVRFAVVSQVADILAIALHVGNYPHTEGLLTSCVSRKLLLGSLASDAVGVACFIDNQKE